MKHPLSQELYDYWNERRNGRTAPERGDIDPAGIKRVLGDSFVLSIEPGEDALFRVAGTRICALFGRELRGETFASIWQDEQARQIRELITSLAEEEIGIVAGASTCVQEDLGWPLELTVLPLSHRGRGGRRMLGALVPVERPFWLGIWPAQKLDLGVVQFIGADIYSAPKQGHAASRIVSRLRGALTVIDGGKM